MLDQFTWDVPISNAGVANPNIRVTIRQKTDGEKGQTGKFNFTLNKAASLVLKLAGEQSAAFSFDVEGELIFAIGVPDTVPSYKLRAIGSGGHQFSNKRFVEKVLMHLGHSRMALHTADDGTITMDLKWREEPAVNGVRFFNLIWNK